jgi:capsular polysaccharide biosynthesis protein
MFWRRKPKQEPRPGGELERRSLDSLANTRVRLAQSASYRVPGCVVYENISDFDSAFARQMNQHVYVDRLANLHAIDLVALGPASLHTSADYTVTVGSSLVEEQAPPWYGEATRAAIAADRPIEEISGEVVIVARYGFWTWGHWLGELLPKLVMVEAAFPGRFRFIVPDTGDVPKWRNFRDSIQAYGVSPHRLILIKPGKTLRLKTAWAVTPIWSDSIMHPAAAELMRCALPQKPIRKARKIAIFREQADARTLVNGTQIAELLSRRGYEALEMAGLDFETQAQLFREAQAVFSTLGSGLTGLIYAPIGVRVLSVAPHIFGDRFFYALVADRRGRYADVRGPIVAPNSSIPHRGSFSVDPDRIAAGLDALDAAI